MLFIENKDGQLEVRTTVYQGKNGGIYLNLQKPLLFPKAEAETFAYEVKDFNQDDFNKFYN